MKIAKMSKVKRLLAQDLPKSKNINTQYKSQLSATKLDFMLIDHQLMNLIKLRNKISINALFALKIFISLNLTIINVVNVNL